MLRFSDVADAGLPQGVHSWWVTVSGPSADGGNAAVELGGAGALLLLRATPNAGAALSVQRGPQSSLAAGAWHCVQWELDASRGPSSGVASLRVDGTRHLFVDAGSGLELPAVSRVQVGFTYLQTSTSPVDVLVDDLALDGAPVDCP